jgi:hypothetical protein
MVRTHSFFGIGPGKESPRLASPDGRLLYSEWSALDWEGNRLFRLAEVRQNTIIYLPTSDPGYFLGIAGWSYMTGVPNEPPGFPLSLTVFAAGSQIPLVTVDGLDEMVQRNPPFNSNWEQAERAFERRFHWVPSAELLVTVPWSNDRLFLRRLGMPGALAAVGGDFLYVTSANLLRVPSGKKLSHAVEVRSRKGGVKFTLADGPAGLTLKPDGLIEWNVPNRRSDFEETAVITIKDASGQSLFHRLKIQVR